MTPKSNAAEVLDASDLVEVEIDPDELLPRVCEDCGEARISPAHHLCRHCIFTCFRHADAGRGLKRDMASNQSLAFLETNGPMAGESSDIAAILAEPVVLTYWGNPKRPRKTPSFAPPRLQPAP